MTFLDRPSDQDDTAAVRAGVDPLARLLAAASAPGHPAELASEQVVLAAFRAASEAGPAPAGAPDARRGALTRVLAVKLAAAVAAVAAASVVFAAGTGILPNPIRTRTVVPTASTTPVPAPPLPPTPGRSGTPVPAPPRTVPLGLCRAYLASTPRGRNLGRPAFERLVEAAGRTDAVEAYCAGLVAGLPADKPGNGPTTDKPGSGPTTGTPGNDPKTTKPGNPSPGHGNGPPPSPPGHAARG